MNTHAVQRYRHLAFAALSALTLGMTRLASGQGPVPISLQASYVGDFTNNVRGGITTGSGFLGMAAVTIVIEAPEGSALAGGSLLLKAVNTHGAQPSALLTGDFQVMTNIEAGDHTYLQEAWYSQRLGDVSLTFGLQDMNAKFAVNEYSCMYLNSSFGVHSTIASNVAAPVFPLTSLAGTVAWNATDRLLLLASVFDGAPLAFERNPHNLKWHFSPRDGIFGVCEAQFRIGREDALHGWVKAGVYEFDRTASGGMAADSEEPVIRNNYGLYFTYDQTVAGIANTAGGVAVFARASISPERYNDNYHFAGAGVNYYGFFREDGSDAAGIAVAHAGLGSAADETVIELTYRTPVMNGITLQPDVQYIINPGGTGEALPNCMAVTVRCGVEL